MESGATISTRRIRPACESAPVMAMVVSVFPVPGQPISMRSAAPLLEMFIDTTTFLLAKAMHAAMFRLGRKYFEIDRIVV